MSLARAYDYGEDDEGAYFTSEYVDGPELLTWSRKAGEEEIYRAMASLLRALALLHDRDLVHGVLVNGVPEPDLIVRTAGEQRLSDFLLWESAYAELYFTPVLWPDFRRDDLVLAVSEYQRRERKFGAVPAEHAKAS